ncbi:MAG: ribonuclease P protein component [Spirochaetes bacterium]|nr:ribonuclease P protein component [Spirochaetota bacterium]
MKKIFSLKGKNCFNEVYEKGKRHKTDSLSAVVLKKCRYDAGGFCSRKADGKAEFKLAVITGKKFGKAYERNRARRRVRAVLNEITFTGNFCMSINVYNGINKINHDELKKELLKLLIKTGVLKDEI